MLSMVFVGNESMPGKSASSYYPLPAMVAVGGDISKVLELMLKRSNKVCLLRLQLVAMAGPLC